MRTFIAAEFNLETKDKIEEVSMKIKNQSRKGNFTVKDNYHITLRFIGETGVNEVDLLKEAILLASCKVKKFTVNIDEVGKFQNNGGNIFWIGAKKHNELIKLNSILSKSLEAEGFSRDKKKFVPHITLARDAATVGSPDMVLKSIKFDTINADIQKISLMESKFIAGRVIYKPLFSADLK